jgi:hypothetical protein
MEIDCYPQTSFGRGQRTPGRHGYVAYFPAKLPRRLDLPAATVAILAETESALGQLAAVGRLVPNPDLLIRPYLLREAVSSTTSQRCATVSVASSGCLSAPAC